MCEIKGLIKMKKRLSALALLLFAMAALPLSIVRCHFSEPAKETTDSAATEAETITTEKPSERTEKQTEKTDKDRETAVSYAASLCDEDFCDEAVRAALILANTNLPFLDGSDYNSDSELKEHVEAINNSDSELLWHGEKHFIPCSPLSGGATQTDSDYPYLRSVASPWDCLDEKYGENADCAGVSMRGVNYLCRRGFTAEESLLHYLPDFTIDF